MKIKTAIRKINLSQISYSSLILLRWLSSNVKLLMSKAYKLLIAVLWNSSQIKEKNWEINFSGDTLNSTIYSIGIILIILATLQIFANAVLLMGALMENERWVPSVITTRVCYLSTFWGTIDAYRASLQNGSEEDSHFLIDWGQAARLRTSKLLDRYHITPARWLVGA